MDKQPTKEKRSKMKRHKYGIGIIEHIKFLLARWHIEHITKGKVTLLPSKR